MTDPQAALDALAAAQAEVESLEASTIATLLSAKEAYYANPTDETLAAMQEASAAASEVRRAVRGARNVALAGDTVISTPEG